MSSSLPESPKRLFSSTTSSITNLSSRTPTSKMKFPKLVAKVKVKTSSAFRKVRHEAEFFPKKSPHSPWRTSPGELSLGGSRARSKPVRAGRPHVEGLLNPLLVLDENIRLARDIESQLFGGASRGSNNLLAGLLPPDHPGASRGGNGGIGQPNIAFVLPPNHPHAHASKLVPVTQRAGSRCAVSSRRRACADPGKPVDATSRSRSTQKSKLLTTRCLGKSHKPVRGQEKTPDDGGSLLNLPDFAEVDRLLASGEETIAARLFPRRGANRVCGKVAGLFDPISCDDSVCPASSGSGSVYVASGDDVGSEKGDVSVDGQNSTEACSATGNGGDSCSCASGRAVSDFGDVLAGSAAEDGSVLNHRDAVVRSADLVVGAASSQDREIGNIVTMGDSSSDVVSYSPWGSSIRSVLTDDWGDYEEPYGRVVGVPMYHISRDQPGGALDVSDSSSSRPLEDTQLAFPSGEGNALIRSWGNSELAREFLVDLEVEDEGAVQAGLGRHELGGMCCEVRLKGPGAPAGRGFGVLSRNRSCSDLTPSAVSSTTSVGASSGGDRRWAMREEESVSAYISDSDSVKSLPTTSFVPVKRLEGDPNMWVYEARLLGRAASNRPAREEISRDGARRACGFY